MESHENTATQSLSSSTQPTIASFLFPPFLRLDYFSIESIHQPLRPEPDDRDKHRAQAMRTPGDEYHYWLANESERQDCLDPIAYWHGMRDKYPRLSQMALDFLTITPMSAEVERLFSSTGRMVTAQNITRRHHF